MVSYKLSLALCVLAVQVMVTLQQRDCNRRLDMVFVVDGSSNVNSANFIRLITAMSNAFNRMTIDNTAVRAGGVLFGGNQLTEIPITGVRSSLTSGTTGVNNWRHQGGNTNTDIGLQRATTMLRNLGSTNAPKLIVLIGSGRSTNNQNDVNQGALARQEGILITAVGTPNADSAQLQRITNSANHVRLASTIQTLEEELQKSLDQACTTAECNLPLDIVFVLDGSNNVQAQNFDRTKAAIGELVNDLDVQSGGISVGGVTYGNIGLNPNPRFFLLQNVKQSANQEIQRLQHLNGNTDTSRGIEFARNIFNNRLSTQNKALIVLVSDGRSANDALTVNQATLARNAGITIVAIGIGSTVDRNKLQQITGDQNNVFVANTQDAFGAILKQSVQGACAKIAGNTSPVTPTPSSNFACDIPADIMFILDGSNTADQAGYSNGVQVVKNLLTRFNFQNNKVQAGFIQYGGSINGIRLTNDSTGINTMLDGMQYSGATANPINAINTAVSILTTDPEGQRSVPKLIVYINKGQPLAVDNQGIQTAAAAARSAGITIYAVAIGSFANTGNLQQIVGGSIDNVFTESGNNINGLNARLVQAMGLFCVDTNTISTVTPATTLAPGSTCNYGTSTIYLLADVSNTAASLSRQNLVNFGWLKNSLTFFMNTIQSRAGSNPQLRAGLISYGSNAVTVVNPNNNINSFAATQSAIANIPNGVLANNVNLQRALQLITVPVNSGSYKSYVVIVTPSDFDRNLIIPEVQRIKGLGYTIVTVPIGNVNLENFREIASNSRFNYQASSYNNLQTTLLNFENALCAGPNPVVNSVCNNGVDVAFVVDGSSNAQQSGYNNGRQIMETLLNRMDIRSGQVNVAGVLFGNGNIFTGSKTDNRATFMQRLRMWSYQGGLANADSGITAASAQLTSTVGPRTVPRLIVFISNGVSSNNAATVQAATQARQAGIRIIAAGYGSNVNSFQLQTITGNFQNVITATDMATMNNLLAQALQNFCANPGPLVTSAPVTTPLTPVTVRTVAPTVRPVPVCEYGTRDVYLVVDVSRNAQSLSQQFSATDFGQLKSGLGSFITAIQNRVGLTANLRFGYIPFSDIASTLVATSNFNSLASARSQIQSIPNGIAVGGSNLANALAQINSPPRQGNYKSYIIVVSSSNFNQASVLQQAQRLKNLGYRIVSVPVGATLNSQNFQELSSGSKYVFPSTSYSTLGNTLSKVDNGVLCAGQSGVKSAGLCASSGRTNDGHAYVSHPYNCDQYIQCYYKADGEFDLSITRTCHGGLFWDQTNKKCDVPNKSQCQNDKCKSMCEPYPMKGNCRGFYACENGVSMPKCCPMDHVFVHGKGCMKEMGAHMKCMDKCNVTKMTCQQPKCNKRPHWKSSSAYYYSHSMSSNKMWYMRPCFGMDFDAVSCSCKAPRGHYCKADKMFDFTNTTLRQLIQNNATKDLTVESATFDNNGVTIADGSSVHIDAASMKMNEPITLKFSYREQDLTTNADFAKVLLTSSTKCKAMCYGNLIVYITKDFISVHFKDSKMGKAVLTVPTMGLSAVEYKKVTLVIDNGHAALSVMGEFQQYVETAKVPKGLHFPCGFDFGAMTNSYKGSLKSVSLSSCTPAKLY